MSTPHTRPVWPAYLIASLALFCGLGGPAHAAGLITGADIRDGSVASVDVKDATVKASDVKDGSIGLADLSDSAESQLTDRATGPACGEGQRLHWLRVKLTANGAPVDDTLRIGRCLGTGQQFLGDRIVQPPEECDGGDGCSPTGQLQGTPGLDFSAMFD